MGNTISIRKYNLEQMQSISNATKIINTLSNMNQNCLILNTIKNTEEEEMINHLLKTNKTNHNQSIMIVQFMIYWV